MHLVSEQTTRSRADHHHVRALTVQRPPHRLHVACQIGRCAALGCTGRWALSCVRSSTCSTCSKSASWCGVADAAGRVLEMMDGYLGGSPVMATRWQLSLSAVECSALGDSKRTRLHLEQHGSAVNTVLSTRDPERPVFAMVFEYYGRLVQYSTVQYSTVQYSTVQYSTVHYKLQYTTSYSTVQYSTVQYCTT